VGEWRDRLVECCKGPIGAHVRSHAFKASAAVAPVEEKGGSGESPAIASQAAEIRPDDRETRGVTVDERIQQHPVNEAENRGCSADTQGDDQDTE
jgi:hypothetical protein